MTEASAPDAVQPFPHLFSPIQLGPLRVKNRIMRVATTTNLAEAGKVGDRMLAFYRTAAEGGSGVLISEAVRLHPLEGVVPNAIPLFDRSTIPGLRRISDAVHAAGAGFLVQLNHGGRQHLGRRVGTLIAPSAIPCPRSGGTPHALTTREVEDMVEFFVTAAVNARDGGADGVELHGAQGHLIGQFLSPFTNAREDRYGGSFENRMRFPREILEGVRRRVGGHAVVGYRLAVEEFTPGGIGIDEACEIAAALVREGLVDYLSLSQGNFNTIETHLPDRHWPILAFRDVQRRIKLAVPGCVVVQSTRIQTPEQAEDVIASGDGDMVGLCRAIVVDPRWPEKARTGRAAEVRRCIACNQCWDWISSGEPVGCATNPEAGREHHFGGRPKRAPQARVVVVGGGPAGLEAARVAAERGLDVLLFERAHRLGGKVADAHRLPHNGELRHVIDFLEAAVRRSGVEIRLGQAATTAEILAEAPHAVVVACGAEPVAPALPGDGSVPVLTATGPDDLKRVAALGRHLVVMDEDGYFWGSAIAEAAAALAAGYGLSLVVATRFFENFRELPMVSRIATLRALDEAGASLRVSTFVHRAEGGAAILKHSLTGREERLDDTAAIVWIGAQAARSELATQLKAAGLDRTYLVGDAYAPRRLAVALVEAHTIARAI